MCDPTRFGANAISILPGLDAAAFGPQVDLAAGSTPGKLAIADLDRDGYSDLVVQNFAPGTISVLLDDARR